MFVDQVRIYAKAGRGGDGSASFRREKFVPKGGPDGGDGGHGGDVILRTDANTDNLVALYYEPIIKAGHGGNGSGRKSSGKTASPSIIHVPVGTVVYKIPAELGPNQTRKFDDEGEATPKPKSLDPRDLEVVVDLNEEGRDFTLCKAGRGGKGNVHFKSSTNRSPQQVTEGTDGEEGHFLFELRTIADAGLVGYPNAGKSTLLRAISSAKPKVAAYPFTTLTPHIGVVELEEWRRFTVADIPGLIEGAHQNVGLGHDFLRHITRCRILLFVLDMAGSEGRSPIEDLQSLRREVKLYDANLAERPWFIVANKMDLDASETELRFFKQRFASINVIPVSADRGNGIPELIQEIAKAVETAD